METLTNENLAQRRFRANPAFELVMLDRLQTAEIEALEGLERDPDCYGILRPAGSGAAGVKSVSRDTALLLYSLREAGPLPRYALRSMGSRAAATVAQMVLDGILEIDDGEGLVSGPAAHKMLFPALPAGAPRNALAALSLRAIEYAAGLGIPDAAVLAGRLYSYNRVPSTARWRALLPDAAAVERHLGVASGAGAGELRHRWTRMNVSPEAGPWIAWRATEHTPTAEAATYKLYVSPACAHLQEAFQAAAHTAAHSGAFYFKAGSDLAGLLRPDKMVLYFREFTALQEAAAALLARLKGCPAQGVPFSADLASTTLVSWGADPVASEPTVRWLERESWRLWVVNHLAAALAAAQTRGAGDREPGRFALDRLRLEGVDIDTWTPPASPAWTAAHDESARN